MKSKTKKTIRKPNLCYLFIKRLCDIIISLIGIVIIIPVSLIVKIIYMCTGDFHSIFLVQKRIGKNRK